jgi:hypothetical protein
MKIVFTRHAEERIKKRNVLKSEVTEAIKQPTLVLKKYNKYHYFKVLPRGRIEIVCEKSEKNIKIITLYWI